MIGAISLLQSERIPGELACTFETMEDSIRQAARQKPELDLAHCRRLHAATLSSVIDWLLRRQSQPALFDSVASTLEVACALDKAGVPAIGGRYVAELHNIRKSITRMGVISRTGALESGFAFLQFLTAVIILLLLLAKFKNLLSEVILVSFVSLIYIYMLGLIKDIDDPFEYNPDGRRRGSAEVELFPLLEYQQRLQERLLPGKPSAPVPQPKAQSENISHAVISPASASEVPIDPDEHANMANTVHATGGASTSTHSPHPAVSSNSGEDGVPGRSSEATV